jgi:hypothetical protein
MKDTAIYTKMGEDGLAVLPFWRHEYEVSKHRKRERKLAIALTATSILLLIQKIKH